MVHVTPGYSVAASMLALASEEEDHCTAAIHENSYFMRELVRKRITALVVQCTQTILSDFNSNFGNLGVFKICQFWQPTFANFDDDTCQFWQLWSLQNLPSLATNNNIRQFGQLMILANFGNLQFCDIC